VTVITAFERRNINHREERKERIMATRNRLIEIYRELGRVLSNPAAFGLGDRAPRPLVEILTSSRKRLMEEVIEQERCEEDEEVSLEATLSQDADTCALPAGNSA
jgi:hypothetical protein